MLFCLESSIVGMLFIVDAENLQEARAEFKKALVPWKKGLQREEITDINRELKENIIECKTKVMEIDM